MSPRRTIADARRALDDLLPCLTDYTAGQYREWLTAAEAGAREKATEYIADRVEQINGMQDRAVRELAEVRDAYGDLAQEGATGRIAAAEYSTRLRDLRTRQDNAEANLDRAAETVAAVEAVEADPVGWYDSEVLARHPRIQPEVPW